MISYKRSDIKSIGFICVKAYHDHKLNKETRRFELEFGESTLIFDSRFSENWLDTEYDPSLSFDSDSNTL